MSTNNRAASRTHRAVGAFLTVALSAVPLLGIGVPAAAADSADYPGVVAVQLENGAITCTGVVLSPVKVLTSAYCADVLPRTQPRITVVAGRSDLADSTTPGGFFTLVSNVWTHPGANLTAMTSPGQATPVDDVAVLTLQQALPAQYAPVQLVAANDQSAYAEGTSATVVGYGDVGEFIPENSTLHATTVPMQSAATCQASQQAFGSTVAFDGARMICAGTPTAAPYAADPIADCLANRGSALFVGSKLVGLRAWSPAPDCPMAFGFYERLSYYSSAITADVNRTNMPANLDFSGDGHSDLFLRENKTGRLKEMVGTGFLYAPDGRSNGGISEVLTYDFVGFGPDYDFRSYKKLFRISNWRGEKWESIVGVKPNGDLIWFDGPSAGSVGVPRKIGTGWASFTDIVVTNNWLGDGRTNLMARTASGVLKLYTSNGRGGWTNAHGTVIGTGWNMFNTVLTPGNWRGQGQSLIGRTAKGDLRLYESNGHGGWKSGKGTLIGTGWNSLPTFLSPGDWTGDNLIDLIGVTSTGAFKVYPTNGKGQWLSAKGWAMTGPSGTGMAWPNMAGLTVF